MFKDLVSFWKSRDFLKEVLDDFGRMMQDTQDMFKYVCDLLIHGIPQKDLKNNLYKIDKRVNKLERKIRIKIVEHLSLLPSNNLPFSLVLMSVVKDAERLGDYAKNLFEVWEINKEPVDLKIYKTFFNDIDKKLLKQFEMTKQAFIESDENTAKEMLDLERDLVRACDNIVVEISESSLKTKEAVCFVLIARYFKRISAHLANIGSSVVVSISNLDFFDEKLRSNKEDKDAK